MPAGPAYRLSSGICINKRNNFIVRRNRLLANLGPFFVTAGRKMPHVKGSSNSVPSLWEEVDAGSLAELWTMFRTHLAARMREINEEVAHYPRPIARCDVQLSKLLEDRARL